MCPRLCALDAVVQANLRKHEQKLPGGGRATSTIIFIRLGRNAAAAAAGMRRPVVSGCVFRRRRSLMWRLYHACLRKHPMCVHTASEKQKTSHVRCVWPPKVWPELPTTQQRSSAVCVCVCMCSSWLAASSLRSSSCTERPPSWHNVFHSRSNPPTCARPCLFPLVPLVSLLFHSESI